MDDSEYTKLRSIPWLTTLDVPEEYWKTAFLVGKIPLRALQSDPRISFALFIPKQYSNPDSSKKKLPLLVTVHGTGRNMSAIDALISFANSTPCAVLAPLFPAGLDGPNDFNSYQILKSITLRSDLALLDILDEVSNVWPGIETSKVFLMGFSGGGQFAHRFMYLYPERLEAVSVGAPGGVTLLDNTLAWPKGVENTSNLFGRHVNKDLIGKLPIQLVVGGADTTLQGGAGLIEWLLKRKAQQGRNTTEEDDKPPPRVKRRVDIVLQLKEKWREDGIEARTDVVDGVTHSSDALREVMLKFLQPLMDNWYSNQ